MFAWYGLDKCIRMVCWYISALNVAYNIIGKWEYVCLWAYKKVHVSNGNCVAIQISKEILMCTCEWIWFTWMSDNCSTCYVRTDTWIMVCEMGKLYTG